jgi:hypothetical protein
MVAFKDDKVPRSDVITRRAGLMTDIVFLPGLSVFGLLLASTNGAGKRLLAWSQGRERLPGNDYDHLYNSMRGSSVRQHTKAEGVRRSNNPTLIRRMDVVLFSYMCLLDCVGETTKRLLVEDWRRRWTSTHFSHGPSAERTFRAAIQVRPGWESSVLVNI